MVKKNRTKKLSTNAKKVIVLCSMVALLVTTGVLNFVFNDKLNIPSGGKNPQNPQNEVESFFNSSKSSRETTRAGELSILESIMLSESSSQEMKDTANAKKMQICKFMEDELILETMIKSQGFSDVIVKMTDTTMNIIIEPIQPTEEQLAQLYSIAVSQTKYKTSQVFVFSVKV